VIEGVGKRIVGEMATCIGKSLDMGAGGGAS
jgi:hypothetical protein